jgi:frataxin-like iron-binding protein CyaY
MSCPGYTGGATYVMWAKYAAAQFWLASPIGEPFSFSRIE